MEQERASTGISGLDEVLFGGLIRNQTYLVTGPAGTGKTTFGWHYLCAGAKAGEPVLFVTFSESEERLRTNAVRSNFDVSGVSFLDLSPSSQFFSHAQSYDIFSPDEVEREPTTQHIVEAIKAVKPRRVFIDSMTHLRYLSADTFQFRKQVLSFLRFLTDFGCDVVFVSEPAGGAGDDDLRYLSDGVIEFALDDFYGRSLLVKKYRGSAFRGMRHSMRLNGHGIEVFPRLLPENFGKTFVPDQLSFGIPELDKLLHGGLERGTTTIITGPSGVGKTTLSLQFMKEAASRGERSVVFTFEERGETLLQRCRGVNIPVDDMLEQGKIGIVEVEALRFTPDEFANLVRREVENGATTIMIDSVRGYQLSVRGQDLVGHVHALCKYLQNMGVTSLLLNELESISEFTVTELGISYLSDNIIFLRYLERALADRVELRKSIGVLKKRLSDFEKDLREFAITSQGVRIEDTLPNVRGILSQMPQVYDRGA